VVCYTPVATCCSSCCGWLSCFHRRSCPQEYCAETKQVSYTCYKPVYETHKENYNVKVAYCVPVKKVENVKVPYCTWKVEQVKTQVCEYVQQMQPYTCKVAHCEYVTEKYNVKVPYCKPVKKMEKVSYQVCKMVPYETTVQVPVCQPSCYQPSCGHGRGHGCGFGSFFSRCFSCCH
jgi:hypothetical protein